MSEEQNQEITSPAAPNNPELDALKNSIQALEKKNYELIGKLKEAKTIPDGVDVQELLEFKRNVEQNKLESEGKYTERVRLLSSSSARLLKPRTSGLLSLKHESASLS